MQIVGFFNSINFDSQGAARLDFIDGQDFPPIQGDRYFFEFAAFAITASLDFPFMSHATTSLEFIVGFIQRGITCGLNYFRGNALLG
jgi:hypothetical protein